MTVEVLYQIFVRLKIGDSRRVIALALGLDKKTVTHYVHRIAKLSFPAETDYVAILAALATILPAKRKPQPALDVLQAYAHETKDLIVGDKAAPLEGMKAKSAW
jgi:hypothetical protein